MTFAAKLGTISVISSPSLTWLAGGILVRACGSPAFLVRHVSPSPVISPVRLTHSTLANRLEAHFLHGGIPLGIEQPASRDLFEQGQQENNEDNPDSSLDLCEDHEGSQENAGSN